MTLLSYLGILLASLCPFCMSLINLKIAVQEDEDIKCVSSTPLILVSTLMIINELFQNSSRVLLEPEYSFSSRLLSDILIHILQSHGGKRRMIIKIQKEVLHPGKSRNSSACILFLILTSTRSNLRNGLDLRWRAGRFSLSLSPSIDWSAVICS